MAIEQRTQPRLTSPGPFIAEITNHLDPSYMGAVEVVLRQPSANTVGLQGNTYIVRYLSPFYGVTSTRFEGNDSSNFNDVQKSYGFWAVPPDVGTSVMVIFVDGDPNLGYWIGCVPDTFQNHMVPGIAASETAFVSPEQKRMYGTDYLPVAEFNKKSKITSSINVEKILKPVHPFADVLLKQGLLLDRVRGVTSSSARREAPSSVFGISTPGPLDEKGPHKKIGYDGGRTAPVSRKGGSTFVMDDGDVNGQNELVRIRTRTGHQILLHNTEDLIYIANSEGTAWIELTKNGKIDIYAADSVSIHSEQNFNFKADGDINLEAGGNINIKAGGGDIHLEASADLKVKAVDGYLTLSGSFNLNSVGSNNLTTGASTNIRSSGEHLESASQIHMNGPAAGTAATTDSIPATGSGGSIMSRVPTHEPWADHGDSSSS